MRHYQIISADGHVEVPVDWSKRVPAKFKEQVPKLSTRDDGTEWWQLDEFERNNNGNLYCGMRFDEFVKPTANSYHFPDGSLRPGTGDGTQRLREQDIDGIDAEILYPPVYGPAFWRNILQRDPERYKAIHRAYNEFLAEYSSVAPDRLIQNCTVPETGVDDAIAEMENCKKLGLRSMCLSMWPNGGPRSSPEDDRFWAASLDLDMRISPHGNFGGGPETSAIALGPTRDSALASGGFGPGYTIGQLVLNGVFDRFPKLKIYFAETNAGWIPHALNMMDEFFMRWYTYHEIHLKKMPSEYYRDHCKFSFIQDRLAMKLRDYSGVEMLMWGSDFPHSVGTYPESREILEELFEGVSEADKRKVLVENPCEFFNFDPEKEITATP